MECVVAGWESRGRCELDSVFDHAANVDVSFNLVAFCAPDQCTCPAGWSASNHCSSFPMSFLGCFPELLEEGSVMSLMEVWLSFINQMKLGLRTAACASPTASKMLTSSPS